jgi:hypothetical protein
MSSKEEKKMKGKEGERGENFIRMVIRRELIYPPLLRGGKLRRDLTHQRRIETLHPAEFAWDGSSSRRKFPELFNLALPRRRRRPRGSLIKIQRACGRSARFAMFPG